jgi:GntR family transcriptional regulator/MocR family aminotransferase
MYGINLDRNSTLSLHFQLAEALRSAVRKGVLPAGEKLASSRILAADLGLSRNLVAEVFEQLAGEGYFTARTGSGTFIAEGLGWQSSDSPADHLPIFPSGSVPERPRIRYPYDFTPGIPDLESFPRKLWLQCENEALSFSSADIFHYGTPLGSLRLRRAVALYLYRLRGLNVPPERVVITAGTQQSLAILAALERESPFAFENPGNDFARNIFDGAGHPLVPLPLDSQGVIPEAAASLPGGSRVFVTPSHQFPTGVLLPIQRRLALLKIARERDLLVLEDDYDSEFRFRGTPVPPLAAMDPERVVYLGTFSKVMAPGLRLGYMVIPWNLKEKIREVRITRNMIAPGPVQETMAFFMEKGCLERHIHRMKRIYRARCQLLLELLERHPPQGLESVTGSETGFHLYLRFKGRSFDNGWFESMKEKGFLADSGGCYTWPWTETSSSLVLGYGNIRDEALEKGIDLLG